MNCDDFLDALTSSDEGRQAAVRWHATSCPSCAALADVDARLKRELSAQEPLPQRMRAVWAAAADDSSKTRGTITSVQVRLASEGRNFVRQLRSPLYILPISAALLFLVFFPLGFWFVQGDRPVVHPGPGPGTSPAPAVAIRQIDASAELENLLAQVSALEAELNKTFKQADLVDVRREADILLATHSHW
ncbi:MAG: hypothetical protein IAF94_01615 [Pirellulaceae bacterium]|nr:hypothetical protein [Pirellulaceae bacterium]